MRRKTWMLLSALAALAAAAPAGVGESLVVGCQCVRHGHRPGERLKTGQKVQLQWYETMTLLERGVLRKLTGPGIFTIGAPTPPRPSRSRLAMLRSLLFQGDTKRRSRIAAQRQNMPLPPGMTEWPVPVEKGGLWRIRYKETGGHCYVEGRGLALEREWGSGSETVTISNYNFEETSVRFENGQRVARWPEKIVPQDKVPILIDWQGEVGKKTEKGRWFGTLRRVDPPLAGVSEEAAIDHMARQLLEKGCRYQLALLLSTVDDGYGLPESEEEMLDLYLGEPLDNK